jgi:small-conductance mechanosensitive channel
VNRTIWALFKKNNITIPVAQREIYVHNLPPDLD